MTITSAYALFILFGLCVIIVSMKYMIATKDPYEKTEYLLYALAVLLVFESMVVARG